MTLPLLFVSYTGSRKGQQSVGWVVLPWPLLTDGDGVLALMDNLERTRDYDSGTLTISTFQRLEVKPEGANDAQ